MTEWEAIGWVFGGIIVAFSAFVSVKNFIEKRDEKITKKAKIEAKEEFSLEKNWKRTEDLEATVGKLSDLTEATNDLVVTLGKEMQAQQEIRRFNVSREILKYDATRALVKHHVNDDEIFSKYLEDFREIEKAEKQRMADYKNEQKR